MDHSKEVFLGSIHVAERDSCQPLKGNNAQYAMGNYNTDIKTILK